MPNQPFLRCCSTSIRKCWMRYASRRNPGLEADCRRPRALDHQDAGLPGAPAQPVKPTTTSCAHQPNRTRNQVVSVAADSASRRGARFRAAGAGHPAGCRCNNSAARQGAASARAPRSAAEALVPVGANALSWRTDGSPRREGAAGRRSGAHAAQTLRRKEKDAENIDKNAWKCRPPQYRCRSSGKRRVASATPAPSAHGDRLREQHIPS